MTMPEIAGRPRGYVLHMPDAYLTVATLTSTVDGSEIQRAVFENKRPALRNMDVFTRREVLRQELFPDQEEGHITVQNKFQDVYRTNMPAEGQPPMIFKNSDGTLVEVIL